MYSAVVLYHWSHMWIEMYLYLDICQLAKSFNRSANSSIMDVVSGSVTKLPSQHYCRF